MSFLPPCLFSFLLAPRSALIQQIFISRVTDGPILSCSRTDLADTGTFKHRNLSHDNTRRATSRTSSVRRRKQGTEVGATLERITCKQHRVVHLSCSSQAESRPPRLQPKSRKNEKKEGKMNEEPLVHTSDARLAVRSAASAPARLKLSLLPPNNDRSQRSASVSIPRGKHWIYYIHTLAALINEQPRKKKNHSEHTDSLQSLQQQQSLKLKPAACTEIN